MQIGTYSHDFDGERFQLPLRREDEFRRELIELGLRVSFDLAQENESSPGVRHFILAARFEMAVA